MPTSSPAAPVSAPTRPFCPIERLKPFLVPYYITVAAVLGAIPAVFAVATVVIVLVVTNFNVLGWME
jgi:hypothetical protein